MIEVWEDKARDFKDKGTWLFNFILSLHLKSLLHVNDHATGLLHDDAYNNSLKCWMK